MKFNNFAILAQTAFVAGNVCKQYPFQAFEPLSNWPAAETFCGRNYPLHQRTETTTTTTTRTNLVTTATSTATIATVTITVGATVTNTDTVETDAITSTTATDTVTSYTSTDTITAYTSTYYSYPPSSPAGKKQKRRRIENHLRDVQAEKSDSDLRIIPAGLFPRALSPSIPIRKRVAHPKDDLLSRLARSAPAFVKTVCSCIETPKPCTTVTTTASTVKNVDTVYVTDVTYTAFSTVTSTLTSDVTETVTDDVIATTIVSTDTTTTTTTISSVTTSICPSTCGASGTCPSTDCVFDQYCGEVIEFPTGGTTSSSPANSYEQCKHFCASTLGCNAYSFDGTTCTLYFSLDESSLVASPNVGAGAGTYHSGCMG